MVSAKLNEGKFKVKKLISHKQSRYGRNFSGKITVRHKMRGCKRSYRLIDFRRGVVNEFSRLLRVEYDPNRGSFLGLLFFKQLNLFTYILLPEVFKIGGQFKVSTGRLPHNRDNYFGWSFLLGEFPISIRIYNVELRPNGGGVLARAAGTFASVARKFERSHRSFNFIGVKLPSGKQNFSFRDCFASLGRVSNRKLRKRVDLIAGKNYHRGIRPHVRGVAMNPVDHPHGGGQGKTSGGRVSVSKWGLLAKGGRTRRKKKIYREKKIFSKRGKKYVFTKD